MKVRLAWVGAVALLGMGLVAQAQVPPAVKAAEASIDPEKIRAHVRFLADDLLEGRGPGLRGSELAAKYIATEFALDGLEPGGDNGTYFQQVKFVGTKVKAADTSFEFIPLHGAPQRLTYGDDYTVTNQEHTPVADVDAPIVFVGYGATAPEFGWDDYAGVDVKGKVILCIVGDPPSDDPKFFGGAALTYYGRWTYKFEQAARMGAVGALIIHRTDLASYGWDVVKNSNTSEKTYLAEDANAKLKAASWIQLEVARRLFAASGLDLDTEMTAAGKRGFKAVELPVRLKAHVDSVIRPFESPNVVGILPGALYRPSTAAATASVPAAERPVWSELPPAECTSCNFPWRPNPAAAGGVREPDQAVLYTAHYDHLGFVPGMAGDNIYNGAADNGTGVGMILELARAWSEMVHAGVKLPHSVIFASVTAEEQGLLGSEYLGQHPPVPAGQIALDINYDMILPIGIPQQVNVNGAQRTSFFPVVQESAKRFGLEIVPDPRPAAGSYYRSDHFNLSRVGIPAFSIETGTLYEGHDAAWGKAKFQDFEDHDYHNFSDNYHADWDFRGNAKLDRFGMELGWEALTVPGGIHWNAGDEFERARKASLGN
jgi:Zn-dependent M28 family amino/carboxypeptidase